VSIRDRIESSPPAREMPPYELVRSDPPVLVPANIPETEARFWIFIAVYGFAMFTCGGACGSMIARAQPRAELERAPLPVALARVCIAEAGWRAIDTGECAAIYAVARSRAERRHVLIDRALREYAGEHFDATRERRRWVIGLAAGGDEPSEWPMRMAWSRYRARWLDTIAHAYKVIRGEVALPCEGHVDHWGGAMDDWRAHRARLVRVRCAGLRNHFWRLPS
jgi:hypothetical protein